MKDPLTIWPGDTPTSSSEREVPMIDTGQGRCEPGQELTFDLLDELWRSVKIKEPPPVLWYTPGKTTPVDPQKIVRLGPEEFVYLEDEDELLAVKKILNR